MQHPHHAIEMEPEHAPMRARGRRRSGDVIDVVEPQYAECDDESCLASFIRYVLYFVGGLLLLIPLLWPLYIKVCDQYERFVVMRLGKVVRPAKGPGLFVFLPLVDDWKRVDLRVRTVNVPSQEVLSKDSVTFTANAVVFMHVKDPIKAVLAVQDHYSATSYLAQTTLRSVIGEHELDDLLQSRERINLAMTRILDEATDAWGVQVTAVEIKDVNLPHNMQRAMASQAEAERERRAKVISSEGEVQASANLLHAAETMSRCPGTMQLRYLQTLTAISVEKNSTIVFPLPIEFASALRGVGRALMDGADADGAGADGIDGGNAV